MSKLKIKSKLKKPLSSQWEIVEDFKLIPMAQDGGSTVYQFDGNSVLEFPINIMQQGGQVRQPIRGTREQYQAYQDSLDLYKQHLKIKPIYPELPQISKEEYDRLHLKEKGLTKYAFDEAQYREDKKSESK